MKNSFFNTFLLLSIISLLTACSAGSGDNTKVLDELSSLSISVGNLDQIFQPNQSSYTATIGYLAQSIKVKATSTKANATITVNGIPIGSDNISQSISLNEGTNTPINIVVTIGAINKLYTITITRQTSSDFAQTAYIKSSNTESNDFFGYSVSISGNTLAIGAYPEDSNATGINNDQTNNNAPASGAVYIFTRTGTDWTQQAYIKASNTETSDVFGHSVSLSGDTLAVGAPDEDSNVTGINGDQTNNSASASGAVYIFTRTGTDWTQQAYIKASNTDANDYFGHSISLSGDSLAVGAYSEDSNATDIGGNQSDNTALHSGAVYVFTRIGNVWTQQAYIKASNTDANDYFGDNVSLSGESLAVGAKNEASNATSINGDQTDNSATYSGAVYIFTRSGTDWTQQAYIKASNTDANDYFGDNVSLSGNTLAVGAFGEDSNATGINGDQTNNNASASGAIYIFTKSGTDWSQQAYIKASNTNVSDFFGYTLSLCEDTLAVGAWGEDSNTTGINGIQTDNSAADSGAVYIFTKSGTVWSQQKYIKSSNSETNDWFGYSVGLSGDTLSVSALKEDSGSVGINGIQMDNTKGDSGAVYTFK